MNVLWMCKEIQEVMIFEKYDICYNLYVPIQTLRIIMA